MAFKILTDSGANLTAEHIKKYRITVLNMGYMIDGKELAGLVENDELIQDIYQKMKNKAKVSTNAVNKKDIEDAFLKALNDGYDILYISFSSHISSSCDNAKITAEEVSKKFKQRRIEVINSMSGSMGEGLLVLAAAKLKEEGKSLHEVIQYLNETKEHSVHLFTVENLMYLYNGGRIKKSAAIIGGLLNIKPILEFDKTETIAPCGKTLGRSLSLKALANLVAQKIENPQEQTIYISHAECEADAKFLQDAISAKVPNAKFEINKLCLVIGAHVGPGGIGVFFLGKR